MLRFPVNVRPFFRKSGLAAAARASVNDPRGWVVPGTLPQPPKPLLNFAQPVLPKAFVKTAHGPLVGRSIRLSRDVADWRLKTLKTSATRVRRDPPPNAMGKPAWRSAS